MTIEEQLAAATASEVATKAKLVEFREANIAMKKQMDELSLKFDGIDPAAYKSMSEEHAKIRDKKMMDAGKIDEILTERTGAMKAAYEAEQRKLAESNTALSTQLERLVIDNAIQTESAKYVTKGADALKLVVSMGRERFKLKDGTAVPVAADGRVIYGKDGVTPQTIGDWLGEVATTHSFLFEPSAGGGADNKGAVTTRPGVVSRGDQSAFGANLEAIAKGTVRVA